MKGAELGANFNILKYHEKLKGYIELQGGDDPWRVCHCKSTFSIYTTWVQGLKMTTASVRNWQWHLSCAVRLISSLYFELSVLLFECKAALSIDYTCICILHDHYSLVHSQHAYYCYYIEMKFWQSPVSFTHSHLPGPAACDWPHRLTFWILLNVAYDDNASSKERFLYMKLLLYKCISECNLLGCNMVWILGIMVTTRSTYFSSQQWGVYFQLRIDLLWLCLAWGSAEACSVMCCICVLFNLILHTRSTSPHQFHNSPLSNVLIHSISIFPQTSPH